MNINILLYVVSIIITIIIAVIVTRYYSTRRILNLVIPSIFDIIDISRIAKEKIQILYKNNRIESLWVIRVVLQNSGNFDIEKNMVHIAPQIDFGNSVKVIDVEPIYTDSESEINAEISEEGFCIFNIGYLKRRKQSAFQILVHTQCGKSIDYKDISLNQGVIENTDIRLINLKRGFPTLFMKPASFFFVHRRTAAIILLAFTCLIIFNGIYLFYKRWGHFTLYNILDSVVYIIMGMFYIVVIYYFAHSTLKCNISGCNF